MLKFVPNIITALRILLAFLFIPFFLQGKFVWTLVVFFVAAISDFLDGYIARKFKVTSKFGAMMDPVADKILMFVSYLLFAYERIIPYYLATVVILRDVLILAVVIICFIKKVKLRFSPIISSKINTAVQLAFVVLVLTCKTFSINLSLDVFVLFVCGMTIYSGLDYARRYKWIKDELCS